MDKIDVMRSELRELTRRSQQMDWQSAKTDSSLDLIKIDTGYLRQEVEQKQNRDYGVARDKNLNMDSDIRQLKADVSALKKDIFVIKADMQKIKVNITKIADQNTDILNLAQNFITKQYFNAAIQDLKHVLLTLNSPMRGSYTSAISKSLESSTQNAIPVDCWEIYQSGRNTSGVYRIQPPESMKPFFVYCDMERWGGGWTVLQTRFDGSVDFYRTYHDYIHGFGNIAAEHWLGLENIHKVTSHNVYELLVDLEDFDNVWSYAHYATFTVGPEVQGFPINILGTYTGDAGDSLTYQAGHKFSTHDLDNDNWPEGSCAKAHHGAWWYNACEQSNLNGLYLSGLVPEDVGSQGMYWFEFRGASYSLKSSRIMVRPAGARQWNDKTAKKSKPEILADEVLTKDEYDDISEDNDNLKK